MGTKELSLPDKIIIGVVATSLLGLFAGIIYEMAVAKVKS